MKKQVIALLASAVCGLILGAFLGPQIADSLRVAFFAFSDMRVSVHQITGSLSTFFAGVIRLSIKV